MVSPIKHLLFRPKILPELVGCKQELKTDIQQELKNVFLSFY
jgi:hypothetical protein